MANMSSPNNPAPIGVKMLRIFLLPVAIRYNISIGLGSMVFACSAQNNTVETNIQILQQLERIIQLLEAIRDNTAKAP